MLEWLKTLAGFFRRSGDDRADLRRDLKSFREAYNDLMKAYQQMAQELRLEVESLRNEVASIAAALEQEKAAHKECRRMLSEHAAEISKLKGQVEFIRQRQTDGGS